MYKDDLIKLITNEPCVVICNESTKMVLLKSIKCIYDITYKSPLEAMNNLCGYYDNLAIYEIKHITGCKYDRAKTIFDSLALGELVDEESTRDLRDKLSKYYHKSRSYNKKIIVCTMIPGLLENELKKYDVTYFKTEKINCVKAYKYNDILDEVEALAHRIASMYELDNTILDRSVIYIGSSDYVDVLHDVFTFYNIPFRVNVKTSLYNIPAVKNCIDSLDLLNPNFDSIKNPDVRNLVVKCVNRLVGIDYTIDDIKDELSNCMTKVMTTGIQVLPYTEFSPIYDYSFVLGVTYKNVPPIHKDDLYYKDSFLEANGIKTSMDLNIDEKNNLITNVLGSNDITLSYSINGIGAKFIETDVLNDIVSFNEDTEYKYEYSKSRALLEYRKCEEEKKVSGHIDKNLEAFKKEFKYEKYYDNSYDGVDIEKIHDQLVCNDTIELSYSKLETFLECPFKYYVNYVLGVYLDSDNANLGSVLHKYLEKYEAVEGYTLKDAIDEFNADSSSKFVLEEPYYSKYLDFLEKLSKKIDEVNEALGLELIDNEVEGEYTYSSSPKLHIKGKIDKVMTRNGSIFIFDYKSGKKISLSDKEYENRSDIPSDYYKKYQLFIYLLFQQVSFDKFGGVFYQRIFPKDKKDLLDVTNGDAKMFNPYGYSKFDEDGDNKPKENELTADMFKQKMDELNKLFEKFKESVLKADFPIDPIKGACKFCNYKALCYNANLKEDDSDESNN